MSPVYSAPPAPHPFTTRRNLKVQDGCDNRCSYCIVHVARGPARSEPLAQLVNQAQALEAAGIRELVLTGINLGRYQDGRAGLAALIRQLLAATSKLRLRLSSIEPPDLSSRLLQTLAQAGERAACHLHLPLQSGCDAVLAAMNRSYTAAQYRECVQAARAALPGLALSTDVIVGFPGETSEQHAETRAFCSGMAFSRMHVFRYSKRPGTAAADLPGQVAPQEAAARAQELRQLAQQLQEQDLQSRIGTSELVLVEQNGRGTSDSYHQVALSPHAPIGALLPVTFTAARGTLLHGRINEG